MDSILPLHAHSSHQHRTRPGRIGDVSGTHHPLSRSKFTLPPVGDSLDHMAVTGLLLMIIGFSAFCFTLVLYATGVSYGSGPVLTVDAARTSDLNWTATYDETGGSPFAANLGLSYPVTERTPKSGISHHDVRGGFSARDQAVISALDVDTIESCAKGLAELRERDGVVHPRCWRLGGPRVACSE